tara:strand:+ start:37 stop:504 length:468 start_codon:yes stop_codon:yes gene_type:complete
MAELTDRYVFVSGGTATTLDAYRIKIDLGANNDRVPYLDAEVISATLVSTDLTIDAYVIKVEESAMNYYSADLTGSCLGQVMFNGVVNAENTFRLEGAGSQLVFGGQTRFLTIYMEDTSGIKQPLADFPAFSMLFKCRFPKVGSIQDSYRQQIPL